MSNTIPTMYTRDAAGAISGVTFYVGPQPYQADPSFPSFQALLDELKKGAPDTAELIRLTQPAQAIIAAVQAAVDADYLEKGKVAVTINEVRYNGEHVEGVLVDRILQALAEGFDIMPHVRFLENVSLNPAPWARDELYLWLENSNLPITEDGHFLAYKKVNANFTSVHDSKTMNVPGTTVEMRRSAVDPIRDHTCSTGLHFCSKSYLTSFGGATTVLLKINPADVVSIPSDYNNAKGRAWKYEVLEQIAFDPQSKSWSSVVAVDGTEFEDVEEDNEDGDNDLLVFPSDLSKALYAALSEIGIDTATKSERLGFAEGVLDADDIWVDEQDYELSSFTELTKRQAGAIIEAARQIKAEVDEETEAEVAEVVATAEATVRQAKIDAINSLGIETLRRQASAAGYVGAYKGPKKAELVAFLISKV